MARSTEGRLTETVNGVEYWFDEAAADAAVAFFVTYLVLTEGEWAGRPFELHDWQVAIIRDVFGWKRPDGTRRYRVLYVEVPRKNGKTELAAGIALLLLVADGELGAQIYTMGVNEDQAKIAFSKATEMVKRSEALGAHVEAFKTSLFCPELNAALKPITSKVVGKQGFNPSGSVSDELHEWKDGDLYRAVREGEGARRQPLDVMITTAGEFGAGFGWEMHEYAEQVIKGEIVDPSFYAVIYAAEEADDWTDPKVWAKANPNYPMSPKHDFLAEECQRAQANPRLENRFKRYFLNQWTEQSTRWLPMADWDAGGDDGWKGFEERLAGKVCYGGLDLSSTTDFSALVWAFGADGDLEAKDGEPVLLLPRLWIPADRVKDKIAKMKRPIDRWIDEGAVIATPGNVVDYRMIRQQVEADAAKFVVKGLGIDRWNATQIATELTEDGMPVELFGQGFASMSSPSKDLERLVFAHRLNAGGHPGLRWMASNVPVAEDPAGNIKPSRDKAVGNIDGIVAAIMGLGLAAKAEDEPESYLNDQDLVFV